MQKEPIVFNYENEFYGISIPPIDKTFICFTKPHLEKLAFLVLNKPWYTMNFDVEQAFRFFGLSIFNQDFYDAWQFEFESAKPKLLYYQEFNPKKPIPSNKNGALGFWDSLYTQEHPIYYTSAVSAAWSIEGWTKTVKKIATHWKIKRQTPYFKFSTVNEACIEHFEKATEYREYNEIFVVNGNFQDFEYLKFLPSVTPSFLDEFKNAIQSELTPICYN